MNHFDELLEAKMKMGLYQYILLISSCLLLFTNGAFQLILPIAAKRLQTELFLSMEQLSLLTSAYQFGCLMGGFFVGFLADHYGRHKVLLLNNLFGIIATLLLFFSQTFTGILAANVMLGTYSSSNYVVLVTYLFEHLPGKTRGRITVVFKSFTTIGRTLGAQIAAFAMNPYQIDYWKSPILVTGMFIVVVFVPFMLVLRESLRFSYSSHDYDSLFQNFNWILRVNRSSEKNPSEVTKPITYGHISVLKTNSLLRKSAVKNDNSIQMYVSIKYLYTNIALTLNRTLIQATLTGFMTVFPQIFGTDQDAINKMTLITSGEYFGTFLCGLIVDTKTFGRKRTIWLNNVASTILFLMIPFVSEWLVVVLIFLTRISTKCSLTAIEIYAVEIYPVKMRAFAAGVNTVVVGATLTVFPFIFISLQKVNEFAIYYLMALFVLVSFVLSYFLQKDVPR